MIKQRTLKTPVKATGVGLHSGVKVEMTVRPAGPTAASCSGAWISTRLPELKADPYLVTTPGYARCSNPARPRCPPSSHLMSALAGLGIDNLLVDLTGPKFPSWTVPRRRSCSCCSPQASSNRVRPSATCDITQPIEVRDGDKWARFVPHNGFKVEFTIDFKHPVFEQERQDRQHRLCRHCLYEGGCSCPHLRLHARG